MLHPIPDHKRVVPEMLGDLAAEGWRYGGFSGERYMFQREMWRIGLSGEVLSEGGAISRDWPGPGAVRVYELSEIKPRNLTAENIRFMLQHGLTE